MYSAFKNTHLRKWQLFTTTYIGYKIYYDGGKLIRLNLKNVNLPARNSWETRLLGHVQNNPSN